MSLGGLKQLLNAVLGLDSRSLAAARIAMASTLLIQNTVLFDSWDVYAFHTDAGVWSISAHGFEQRWSLQVASGSCAWALLLHLLLVACSFLLLLG